MGTLVQEEIIRNISGSGSAQGFSVHSSVLLRNKYQLCQDVGSGLQRHPSSGVGAGIGLPCFLPGPLAPFLSPSRYSLGAGLASGFVLSSRTDSICVSGTTGKPDKQVQIFDFFF